MNIKSATDLNTKIKRFFYRNFYKNNNLIIKHNAGFFSCCSIILEKIQQHYNETGYLPHIDSTRTWLQYKDDINQDVTPLFFKRKKRPKFSSPKIKLTKAVEEMQFSNYADINFETTNPLINTYFNLSNRVKNTVNKLIEENNLNLENTIAVYLRGNDKSLETNIPTYEEMLSKIKDVKEQFPEKQILIQCDEQEFYEYCSKHYPNILYFENILKISHNKNKHVGQEVKKGEKVNQAILFLSIIKIISQSSTIILNSGNVAMWICLFRGNVKNVYQYLSPKKEIYGVPQENIYIGEKWICNLEA